MPTRSIHQATLGVDLSMSAELQVALASEAFLRATSQAALGVERSPPILRHPTIRLTSLDWNRSEISCSYIFSLQVEIRSSSNRFTVEQAITDEALFNLGLRPPPTDQFLMAIREDMNIVVGQAQSEAEFFSVIHDAFKESLLRNLDRSHERFRRPSLDSNFAGTWWVNQSGYYEISDFFDQSSSAIAIDRAKKLLLSLLNKEQQRDFEKTQSFVVENQKERFRIRNCINYAVISERTRTKFCVVVPGVPIYDQMAALKLLLESDPEEFFRLAH